MGSLAGVESFNVYRATSPDGPFVRVNEEAIPRCSPCEFEDVTVWPETVFWYELRAVLADDTEDVVGSPASVTTHGKLQMALHSASPNPFTDEALIQSATIFKNHMNVLAPSEKEPEFIEEEEVGGGEVVVAGDGDQGKLQPPGHVFHEAGLAAAGWALE